MSTETNIPHLASLARLQLSPEELAKLAEEIPDMLAYVGKLSEVDTTGIAPMISAASLHEALREDDVAASRAETRAALLQALPDRVGDLLRVQSILAHKVEKKYVAE